MNDFFAAVNRDGFLWVASVRDGEFVGSFEFKRESGKGKFEFNAPVLVGSKWRIGWSDRVALWWLKQYRLNHFFVRRTTPMRNQKKNIHARGDFGKV